MAPKRSAGAALGETVSSKKKQGNLFSFFSKKKKDEATPSATKAPPPTTTEPKPSVQVRLGSMIEVFWPDDDTYYAAKVLKGRGESSYFIEYTVDGTSEWIDLSQNTFREKPASKRQRIDDDDEESDECEFQDVSSDEESAYKQDDQAADEDDEDEADQWMVSDEEGEEPAKRKKPATTSAKTPKSAARKTRTITPSSAPSNMRAFAYSATKTPPAAGTQPTLASPAPAQSARDSLVPPTPAANASQASSDPPPFVKNVLNAAGSHAHHHLPFLRQPHDSKGRSTSHPDYDPRTLRVSQSDWLKVMGAKMTNAVQQWWEMKSRYFDTVLLFKTGKFYELYHMDADVGVQVCGLAYMKGHVAHCGFPEAAYAGMADKLVKAGYKVARVEQTETPEMLATRKKNRPKGQPAPKVVNREVCGILTPGTRTFDYLDINAPTGTQPGPLLSVCQIVLESPEEHGPAVEYGITVVDAIHGTVTMGQFADDVLRSRLDTLLAAFRPSEILIPAEPEGISEKDSLKAMMTAAIKTTLHGSRLEVIRSTEEFAKSTALDPQIRRLMERPQCHPWDVQETLGELHRKNYYPKASKKEDSKSISRWPEVLQAAVRGDANLALSSLGAALFYLQRNLIDAELLSMGIVHAYVPPSSSAASEEVSEIQTLAEQQSLEQAAVEVTQPETDPSAASPMVGIQMDRLDEGSINHLALDGTTLHNLEILYNSVTHKSEGSLWSKINRTKTPHGARLLRAWLLRPLFRKADIDRRTDAVEELVSGAAAVARENARRVLSKCGDIERLLSRVHSMSGATRVADNDEDDTTSGVHPNERAVLYETAKYTKRKVEDFSRVLKGLRATSQIPEIFRETDIESGLLSKIVRLQKDGGCFPEMDDQLEWFFDNFDLDRAAKGQFEPTKGVDTQYDRACETVDQILSDLKAYKDEMCNTVLAPRSTARSTWNYINLHADSKDKYTIELSASVEVPDNFIMKGKKGKGAKQVNRYRTAELEDIIVEYEKALDIQRERKAKGMQLIFAKFDSMRNIWAAAAQATSLLDALSSLAQVASKPGYTRAKILDCPSDASPSIRVLGGRHPCVEDLSRSDFVPNNLELGGGANTSSRVLLLSGPNMGGKSTLLRQTCLISIMAQIGCFVPADECELTPVDRVYTRLGASDRILLGQSTFFVELAETAAALRGASRRSLVIMDELGRGTSTFDGTAIASAVVKHLIERSRCVALFATHYHSLLEEWKSHPNVRLGHMECLVENGQVTDRDGDSTENSTITFLYTLGEGVCPRSFGINVARLAGLPVEVLQKAQRISTEFEKQMDLSQRPTQAQIESAIESCDWAKLTELWNSLQVS